MQQPVDLRDRLADLILRTHDEKVQWHKVSGRFGRLAIALAMLCDRQLTQRTDVAEENLIAACVIANRFGEHRTSRDEIVKLRGHFASTSSLREQAFLGELALVLKLSPGKDEARQLHQVEYEGLIGALEQEDRVWLEVAAGNAAHPAARRGVAAMGLVQLWAWRGRVEAEVESIRNLVADDERLHELVRQRTQRIEPDPELRKLERDNLRYKRIREGREKQRREGWLTWRQELLADIPAAFTPEKIGHTVRNLYAWLDSQKESSSRFAAWDPSALAKAFDDETVRNASVAFRAMWRAERPATWSQRKPADRHSTPYVWIYGLCGLTAEASTEGWATRLTSEEAAVAATYATIELNGLPEWLGPLADARSAEVVQVLGHELDAQLMLARDVEHLPLLQDLAHSERKIKGLIAPRVLAQLEYWAPPTGDKDVAKCSVKHLSQLLKILIEGVSENDRRRAADLCAERAINGDDLSSALPWLRELFKLDGPRAAALFASRLQGAGGAEASAQVIESFATLFGDSDGVIPEIADNSERARVLSQLVRVAYAYVRREDDREHEGSYTPNVRDHAERARNILLSALLDTPGPVACEAILGLAQDQLFDYMPDRLRLLARNRAATDAEPAPLQQSAIVELETRFETRPRGRDELFETMTDRLADLAHDIAHDDFTDRPILQSITAEHLMQLNLARRLRDAARDAYRVTREEEVADRKETDIRLSTVDGSHRAAIEVKIADNEWTVDDLERALVNQLVGQYLRHKDSKVGCLLLTYSGRKQYWLKPNSQEHMSLEEVVAHLSNRALQIEHESNGEYRLAVVPLDLRNPVLAPAHR